MVTIKLTLVPVEECEYHNASMNDLPNLIADGETHKSCAYHQAVIGSIVERIR